MTAYVHSLTTAPHRTLCNFTESGDCRIKQNNIAHQTMQTIDILLLGRVLYYSISYFLHFAKSTLALPVTCHLRRATVFTVNALSFLTWA